eukprot:SAG11_NODE_205_length_12427_cov_8.010140_8_plen_58_part_00
MNATSMAQIRSTLTCSQFGTYNFLETSSMCLSHVFRRAYKGSRKTNVWLHSYCNKSA